jgi:hypothetical protein
MEHKIVGQFLNKKISTPSLGYPVPNLMVIISIYRRLGDKFRIFPAL